MGDAVSSRIVPSVRRTVSVPPIALAVIAGALLALSFPRFGTPVIAWVALAPLLVALAGRRRQPTGRAFTLGLACGVVHFAGTVYWTSGVMARYGGIQPPVAAAIAGLLVAFLALFPAMFAATMGVLLRRLGRRALLVAPAVWVATELGRTLVYGGFPWALLGYSQTSVLPVAQLASLTGVYGVSALVVFVSAALAFAALERGRAGWQAVTITIVTVGAIWIWGSARIADGRLLRSGAPVTVGVIQGNVSQDRKWDRAFAEEILQRYLQYSRDAARRGARLILWPESATPFYFEENVGGEAIRQLAREEHVWMLVGSDEFERSRPPRSYNAAFMLRPDGATAGVYRKVRLVPFGEYVPFRRLLFFAAPLVEAVGEFSPGESVVTLPFAGGRRISTAICYEVVYPALIREAILRDSALLTTITNDAWFGRSSAPWQHFEMAAMRAIEQGRYLARAANTGVSGFVDPYGRVIARSDLFVDQVLVSELRLLDERTWYARLGDVVAWVSAAITAAVLAAALRVRIRS